MQGYKLKNVAEEIATNGIKKADSKKLMSLLSQNEINTLLKHVKNAKEKRTVRITVADALSKETKKTILELFKEKNVEILVDPKIGAGIQAQVYDMIYDLSIKSEFERLAHDVKEEL